MKYLEIVAEFNENNFELDNLNTVALKDYGCDGVHEYSLEEDEIDKLLGARSYGGGNPPSEIFDEIEEHSKRNQIIYAYCFSEENEKRAISWMNFLLEQSFIFRVDLIEKPYEDWNEKWREHYQEIEIAEDFSIIPSWQKENKTKGIYLYPGQGFGTGQHETTYLCLKLFYQIKNISFSNCLDYGCGSGVLGLGVRFFHPKIDIDFYDIEKEALENTKQNLSYNEWENEKNLNVFIDPEKMKDEYSLVFANILANTLIELKEDISSRVKEDGYLILSGILNEQVEDVLDHYKSFKRIQLRKKGDWSAILLKR